MLDDGGGAVVERLAAAGAAPDFPAPPVSPPSCLDRGPPPGGPFRKRSRMSKSSESISAADARRSAVRSVTAMSNTQQTSVSVEPPPTVALRVVPPTRHRARPRGARDGPFRDRASGPCRKGRRPAADDAGRYRRGHRVLRAGGRRRARPRIRRRRAARRPRLSHRSVLLGTPGSRRSPSAASVWIWNSCASCREKRRTPRGSTPCSSVSTTANSTWSPSAARSWGTPPGQTRSATAGRTRS